MIILFKSMNHIVYVNGHLIYLNKIDKVNYDNIININKTQFLFGIIKEISILINKPIPIIDKNDINNDNYIKIDFGKEYYIHNESFLSFFLNSKIYSILFSYSC